MTEENRSISPARWRSLVVLCLVGAGCGQEIGDSCTVSYDCAGDGSRQCDMSQKDGYCTILGCDYNTCPSEGSCIRFFTGQFDNKPCDHLTEGISTHACSLDELCDLQDHCVPRATEVRYCMRTCQSNGDCRDGYECRNLQLMIAHGGEPVLAPGLVVDANAPNFCAAAPAM